MLTRRRLLAMRQLGGGGVAAIPALTLTATTTGASQSVTLNRMTPADGKTLTVSWGDGSADTTINAGDVTSKAHTYDDAGTYPITVTDALDIVQIDLRDARLSGFKSAELADSAITNFTVFSLGSAVASVVSSADMAAWPMTGYWQLHSMPAGTYTIDTQHMASWSITRFYLHSMPAGTYTINSSHLAGMALNYWWSSDMPAGTTFVLSAANFAGFTAPTYFRLDNNGLLQAQVDAILTGLYQAFPGKTSTGGQLLIGGNNAAPSGTFQAPAGCPPTDGKEIAYELLNDTCDISTKHWATVTITA